MGYWNEADRETIEAYVEALLERVVEGTDDVETAKVDLLSLLTANDRKSAQDALFGATCLLRNWRMSDAQRS